MRDFHEGLLILHEVYFIGYEGLFISHEGFLIEKSFKYKIFHKKKVIIKRDFGFVMRDLSLTANVMFFTSILYTQESYRS